MLSPQLKILYPLPNLDISSGSISTFIQHKVLNSDFSFSLISCYTKVKEPNLSYYFPELGEKIVGFITFQRVLAQCEMQTVFFRIWTLVAMSMFANDPGDQVSIPGRVIPKTQKMVLDAALLSTQHYKVRIKGKVE